MQIEPRMKGTIAAAAAAIATALAWGANLQAASSAGYVLREFPVPPRSHPHDVAPAPDGGVWYTAQVGAALGYLDPATGRTREIKLGAGSAHHGVVVGPDGAPWITDGGLNAIVRVDPKTNSVTRFSLPRGREGANLNTATFDHRGVLWFTGQSGVYGRLDPSTGKLDVFDAPRGRGPYGICTAPDGSVYFASLAGSFVARLDTTSGGATLLDPPTAHQGARRVWADSKGRIWVSEWNVGQLGVYDPASSRWHEWRLPSGDAQPYAVYVDDQNIIWLSDLPGHAPGRLDPRLETFQRRPLPPPPAPRHPLPG